MSVVYPLIPIREIRNKTKIADAKNSSNNNNTYKIAYCGIHTSGIQNKATKTHIKHKLFSLTCTTTAAVVTKATMKAFEKFNVATQCNMMMH